VTTPTPHFTPQDSEEDREPPKRKNLTAPIPGDDIKLDGYHHWSRVMDLKAPLSRRYKGCTSRSKFICTKCKIYLCMSKGRICFEDFHNLK